MIGVDVLPSLAPVSAAAAAAATTGAKLLINIAQSAALHNSRWRRIEPPRCKTPLPMLGPFR
ncbi:MAG TPA: hypothetical protein VGM07_06695 [Stellaceae bacterium]